MQIYADYSFYHNTYKGSLISESAFNLYAIKATKIIQDYTFGNVPDVIPEEVKYCCCEIADALSEYQNSNAVKSIESGVSSESVGGWSVSYGSDNSAVATAFKRKISDIINVWLSDTGLTSSAVKRSGYRC